MMTGKMKFMLKREAWILATVGILYLACWLYLYCVVYAVTPSDSLIDTMGEPFKVDMFIACDSTLVDPVHSVCCVYVCDCDTVEIVW
jgi:hypothetical protein